MNIEDGVMGCFGISFAVLVGGLVIAGGAAALDGMYFGRKAFAAATACEVRRMNPSRQFLSAHVVCVPANTRQDTTTVQVR